jgi:hypothetical protein
MDEPVQEPQTNSPAEASTPTSPPIPLTYEETPIIENVEPPSQPTPKTPQPPVSPPTPVKKRTGSCLKTIGIIILVILLFASGVWLSSFVRQFLPSTAPVKTQTAINATPTPDNTVDPYATWKSYEVISGITKAPILGVQFKLPPDVLSPICDGTSCVSQGTYLPGGTRLTVAARGINQSLRDFRGTVITDANNVPIPSKTLPLGEISATEYESSQSGRTVSGYAFSQIRGVMIPLTDSLSIEINHFTPSGINADFTADDTLFDSIIKTVTYSVPITSVTPTITVPPVVVTTPASATASGN